MQLYIIDSNKITAQYSVVGAPDYEPSTGNYEQIHKENDEATSNQDTLKYDYPTVSSADGSKITVEYDVIVDTNSATRNETYSTPKVPTVAVNPSYMACDTSVNNTDEQ